VSDETVTKPTCCGAVMKAQFGAEVGERDPETSLIDVDVHKTELRCCTCGKVFDVQVFNPPIRKRMV
jgi:hypothetical protein